LSHATIANAASSLLSSAPPHCGIVGASATGIRQTSTSREHVRLHLRRPLSVLLLFRLLVQGLHLLALLVVPAVPEHLHARLLSLLSAVRCLMKAGCPQLLQELGHWTKMRIQKLLPE